MKKMWKALAVLTAIALFGSAFTACKSDDDGDDGENNGGGTGGSGTVVEKTAHLVKFNAADTQWAATDMVIKGSASSGGKEGYLVLNHKIDLEKDDITIEADVKFSSLSGHVGLGFIAVDGSNRKAYSLLSGQNIKNVSCSLGGGGNGLTPAVSWSVDKTYHFKAALSASTKEIVYTVTDEAGTESINKTPIYHDVADVVYPALGGTTAENASYSNIKIAVKNNSEDTTYTFDGLDEQDVLSALSVNTSAVRLLLNGESTVTYTSTAKGEASGVNLEYDNSILEVTDDGNGTLTVKGIKPSTGTTLKVINKGATYITATISVVVEDFNAEDGYGALTTVYPAANAEAAFEDGEFRITFDDVPAVSDTGSISIYDAEGNWVDTIKASNEVISVPTGKDINVKNQMIRVEGNSVYFTPHYGVLEAGKTYYIAIPKDVITAKLNGKDFTGLTNDKDKASWKFTTRAAVSASSTITVDGKEDSTANFRTIHGALLAIGAATGDYTIEVAPGTYREIIHFNGTANITITGTGSAARGADTVIQWTNLNKWNGSMDTRSVMYFGDKAGNVVLNNITIKNTCDRAKEGTADTQAEAFYYKSTNKVAANNCTFLSHQDTICTKGKAWFYNCYIEGDTDFIWGYSDVALFEKCDLVCLYDSAKSADSNYSVLFVARTGTKTAPKIGKGYVLLNSTVTVKDGVTNYLGRNAGSGDFYDQIALVNVAFTNEGTGTTSTDLWRDANVYDYLDGKEDKIGLKFYNLTGNIDTSAKIAHVAELSADAYAKEFNGRRAILNRVYKVEDDAYVAGETYAEDYLSALETAFAAEEDASKGNEYGEEAANTWMCAFTADGTYTDGKLAVTVSGTNSNGHGVEVKKDNSSVVTISIPAGSYVLAAGTCNYGTADKPYVLTCSNEDFVQEYFGTHTYAAEDCYNPGSSRTDLYGDYYFIKSASDMVITLNSDTGVKEYLPFIMVVKEPKYFAPFTADGTYTSGDMSVTVSGTNSNGHGVEVKKDNSSVVTISIPAGSYVLAAGTCNYGTADSPYVISCANSDFKQEYIGTHSYTGEDCYNPGSSRTDLYGDYYFVKSAEAMEITLNSATGKKEYLPFIGAIK